MKHPDSEPEIFKGLWETIAAGKAWHGLVKNSKKDGGYYWVETVITQDFDAFGRPFWLYGGASGCDRGDGAQRVQ